ncbi:micronuclear linker histone polyprotein isoform X1 [Bactrocera oleae]|uniref:micronuclear linker histone polyprotein isoform X1 n=1 Tax=Bactrocera oleae TaxID=104688 RepID=UPI00387E27F5
MYQISKLSVLRALTQTIRYSASKGGSSKDGKGDSKCAPGSKGGSSASSKDGKGDSKSGPVIKGGSSKPGKSDSKCAPPSKSAASVSSKDGKSESKCVPIKKLNLCESKKGEKDAKASRCGGIPTADKKPEILGGAGRESSCKPKKQPPTKGTSTAGTFRKICLFAILPAVVLLNILILTTRTHPERQEFKKWPHLYKRDKPFSWGDGTKSFFHNPHTNALPEIGYEDE